MSQGHGIEGRYGGLPDAYAHAEHSKVVILPVPFDLTTTYQKGSDKGPAALIEASRNMELYDIETNSQVYLKGIYTDEPIVAETSEEMLHATYQRAKEWIAKDKFLVTLGGEHSISYGPIKAQAEHYNRLTILQLDAHTDLQPAYENNPWSHASVMARVKEIPEVKKLIAVGIRSMSEEELPYLNKESTFFAHTMRGKWIDDVLSQIEGPVYISFDLDVFDSSLMPSTGTPEPGGMDWYPTVTFLKRVMQEKQVVGCDIVELCPNPSNAAPDFVAAKLLYKMLSYRFI